MNGRKTKATQKPSATRSFGRKLYLVIASLILLGVVCQGVLIGPSLFTGTTWGQTIHASLGATTVLLAALHPATALLMVALLVLPLVQGWRTQFAREER
jgi:hypothetical protein